jgi:uncharacterized protein YdaU (DUF1376 family)
VSNGKSPAFSIYPKDWLASEDIALMPPEAEGLFIRLLMIAWDNRGLPTDADAVRKLAGTKYARVWKTAWPPVRKKFVERSSRLVNLRQEQERDKQTERAKKAAEAAKSRWDNNRPDANASAKHMLAPSSVVEPKQSLAVAVASASTKPTTKPSAPKAPGATWLSPFLQAWTATYGGNANPGRLAKSLKPLTEAHAPGEVLDHWTRYLAATEARYASPERFAETFGSWAKPERAKQVGSLPDAYLTLEEQAARNAKARTLKNAPRDDVQMLTDIAGGQ